MAQGEVSGALYGFNVDSEGYIVIPGSMGKIKVSGFTA